MILYLCNRLMLKISAILGRPISFPKLRNIGKALLADFLLEIYFFEQKMTVHITDTRKT